MAAPSPLELRRRSAAERRALELLRGGRGISMAPHPLGHDRSLRTGGDEKHKRLREIAMEAMRHGFAIQPPKASYVHLDELRLLHLIADAQAGRPNAGLSEPLASAVTEAARMLASFGINLLNPAE